MKSDTQFLRHILDKINFTMRETRGLAFENFIKNETLTRACTRSLEIIGEAVKNLSPEFRKKHREIDWRKIAGMRDKVIHFYFGVNWDIVWDVIENRLPVLKIQIENMLNEMKTENEETS